MSLRKPAKINAQKQKVVRSKAIPAPVAGWDASTALAAMKSDRAVQLTNWFPQPGYVEVRRGHKYQAWGLPAAVETLAVWQGPTSSKLFAGSSTGIYDVTSTAAATLAYAAGASSARWQWCNHTTSAGAWLLMGNGLDTGKKFDGTTWSAASITGLSSAVAQFISHKRRLWMVLADSTKGAYLGTDAIGGAATEFQFGSLFTRGGYLQAIATWTRDGGAGSDDYLVAISSRGQVALYSGTDPASSTTWALVGVFDVPTPIGRRCFAKYGADLLLITLQGVYPLSQLLAVDESTARRVSISANIATAFNEAAQSYGSLFGWEACVYPKGTRIIVNVPTAELSAAKQYVMNTLTGGWCEFTGMAANCWAVYNDNLYFGGDETVFRADTGRADVDTPITAVGQTAYGSMGTANLKRFSMVRPLITTGGSNRPAIGVSVDFVETTALSSLSASTATTGTSLWDTALWDTALWSGGDTQINDWANVVGLGTFGSIKFQAQTGISVGSSGWGTSTWGRSLWGSEGLQDETMRIQGFLALAEVGEFI